MILPDEKPRCSWRLSHSLYVAYHDNEWGVPTHGDRNYKPLGAPEPPASWEETPSRSPESDAMSRDLKRRGFRFVGPTICYAHMQATGMVDDQMKGCFKARR